MRRPHRPHRTHCTHRTHASWRGREGSALIARLRRSGLEAGPACTLRVQRSHSRRTTAAATGSPSQTIQGGLGFHVVRHIEYDEYSGDSDDWESDEESVDLSNSETVRRDAGYGCRLRRRTASRRHRQKREKPTRSVLRPAPIRCSQVGTTLPGGAQLIMEVPLQRRGRDGEKCNWRLFKLRVRSPK